MRRTDAKHLGVCLCVMLAVGLFTYFGWFSYLDNQLMDSLYQRPRTINPQIKIIAIDEKTLARAESTSDKNWGVFGTWSRSVTAQLLDYLNQSEELRPAVIGMDIMYFGNSTLHPEGDAQLAQAAERFGNVVTASQLVFEDKLVQGSNGTMQLDTMSVRFYDTPYSPLDAATRQGFSNATADGDGFVRTTHYSFVYQQQEIPSLASACYQLYMEERGEAPRPPATDSNGRWWIPYAGKPGSYEQVSFIDVIDGKIPAEAFDDCIVLVGAYATGLLDAFGTPIYKGGQMYGVEVHANTIQALLEGRSAVPPRSRLLLPVCYALLAGLLYLACRLLRPFYSLALLVAAVMAQLLIAQWLYRRGIVLSLVYLPLAAAGLYLGVLINNYLTERLRRRLVTDTFKKFVAPQVVDEMLSGGQLEPVLGGEARSIAVFFVDIRGFTAIAENLPPEQVVEILNAYLNLVTKTIFSYGGTLDKFIGDAAMAIFNAPFDLPDYAYQAVAAAWELSQGADALCQQLQELFGVSIRFGIGIHCGQAVVGNMGCDFRMEYTAIGDAVNTTARLEGIAKPGQILISHAMYQQLENRIKATSLGCAELKGKSVPVQLYQLDALL